MARVHARFDGRPGTFAHFGDSITDTLAFWTPLRYGRKAAPPEMERAYKRRPGLPPTRVLARLERARVRQSRRPDHSLGPRSCEQLAP